MVNRFEALEQRALLAADLQVLETFGTNNVTVAEDFAFAAAGAQGLLLVDLESLEVVDQISPPGDADSIDDIAISADLLFALDGSRPGNLSVFSIEDPLQPTLVSGPVPVDVGPFAGVSAANGRVIVSGGTGQLTVIDFDANGGLDEDVALADLGVGQPDLLIAEDGETAFVSTDFSGRVDGQSFGVTLIDVPADALPISILDRVGIEGAGFTPGFGGPANFPIESAQRSDSLFVASGAGVSVFDVSDRQSLRPVTEILLDTNPVNIDVLGDHLFVIGSVPTSTLTVIEITDLEAPVIETVELPTDSEPLALSATEEHIVIADSRLGLLVSRTEDFTQPEATEAVFADIDGDGLVRFSDFLVLATNFGQAVEAGSRGDLDEDGVVSFADFLLFASEFASQNE